MNKKACKVSTGDYSDFSNLSGMDAFQEAARQLFEARVLTQEEHRAGRISARGDASRLDTERKNARDRLMAKIASLQIAPDLRIELEARLSELDGATNLNAIRLVERDIAGAIHDASEYSTSQATLTDYEMRDDAKRAALMQELAEYRGMSQKARDEFRKRGYGDTKENEDKLATLWAKMEKLEPGSPEWFKTVDEIQYMDTAYFQHVKEEALKKTPPDMQTVKIADEALKSTRASHEHLRIEEAKSKANIEESKVSSTGGLNHNRFRFGDDDESAPAVASAKTPPSESPAKGNMAELGNLSPTVAPVNTPSNGHSIG